MIGKGKRSKEVIDAIIRNKAVYFAAVGGAGALLQIEVENFPAIVVIDSQGNNLYEESVKEFCAL